MSAAWSVSSKGRIAADHGLIGSVVVVLVALNYREEEDEAVIRIISARKQRRMKGGTMNKIDSKQAKELRDLEKMNPSDIDLSDLPEVRDWDGAVVGTVLSSHQEAAHAPDRCPPLRRV